MAGGNFRNLDVALILLSGLPGAGKTTFARALANSLTFCHVESDAIRRTMVQEPTYSAGESARVFARVEADARKALGEGRHALIDATNLTTNDRRRFVRLAGALRTRLIAIRLTAPEAVIRERLARARDGYSQADIRVYEQMRGRAQAFAIPSVVVDTRFSLEPAIALVRSLVEDAADA